jgi:phage terminase large subunit-like protein
MNAEPTPEEIKQFVDALGVVEYAETYERFKSFEPYPKQERFLALGRTKRERLLTAGNQQGKTETGAFEVACHLTGEYPPWWKGRVWDRPTKGWIAGETALAVRDTQQKKLCGEPGVIELFGTGMIPKDLFVDTSLGRSISDGYDTIQVRHKSGGISIGRFKSYEQGRSKFQGDTLDWVWNDEECPMEIYSEELARITATQGMIFTTFTSMKGATALTNRFHLEESPDRDMVKMGIKDALHIPVSDHEKIIAGYLPHEREARIHGGIIRGHGRVFELSDELISEPMLTYIPPQWTKLWGIDFGIGHPFAAVLCLWDKDNDVIHVHHCIRIPDQLPIQHAFAMKQIGAAVPVAWPKDGGDREKSSGEPLAAAYKKHGLLMGPDHATWPEDAGGGISTEAGILEMIDRMRSGRLKVANHLAEWFEEYRDYHRKDGQIVKIRDDLMSATRVAIMAKRFGRSVSLGSGGAPPRGSGMARNVDFDPFS